MTTLERHEIFREIMTSDRWTESEKWVLKAQLKRAGGFASALWQCFALADEANFAQLSLGFPEQAAAFLSWRHGDLADRFRAAGVEEI